MIFTSFFGLALLIAGLVTVDCWADNFLLIRSNAFAGF